MGLREVRGSCTMYRFGERKVVEEVLNAYEVWGRGSSVMTEEFVY